MREGREYEAEKDANNLLQVTQGGAGEVGLQMSAFVAAPPCAPEQCVKRTHTAAPPHHAVAPDIAESRSQVNCVVSIYR